MADFWTEGIIPARAGFTRPPGPGRARPVDHPRSRGVYRAPGAPGSCIWGSSPLARGLRGGLGGHGPAPGIIPARAGFTGARRPRAGDAGDHPRSRGVYAGDVFYAIDWEGSSPLARGLHDIQEFTMIAERIIPARAGFTRGARQGRVPRRDHPRSRGVYDALLGLRPAGAGSSPLARGLPPHCTEPAAGGGIIPARAGFTRPRPWPGTRSWDHPRSRGVYDCAWVPIAACEGSSPLARGLPALRAPGNNSPGIIPARAGFTASRPASCSCAADHPRSRGVYDLLAMTEYFEDGSSPLARGLRTP